MNITIKLENVTQAMREDNEFSYYRQCVKMGLEEIAGDWHWKNVINSQIERSVPVFAEGRRYGYSEFQRGMVRSERRMSSSCRYEISERIRN